jgi:hypothetical protein
MMRKNRNRQIRDPNKFAALEHEAQAHYVSSKDREL